MARFSNDHMPSVATQARTAWQQRLNTASQACEISLQAQLDRFSQLEWDLFATSEEMHVDMTDIYESEDPNAFRKVQQVFTQADALQEYVSASPHPSWRIISISAPNSVLPLNITPEALWQIIVAHDLPPSFLDLVSSFATNGQEAEAGPGALTVTKLPDESYDIQCCYQYVEEAGPEYAKDWVIRQTGIFHHYRRATKQNLLIFLHPRQSSPLELQIKSMIKTWTSETASDGWTIPHLSLFACYASGWRWYLKSISSKVNQMAALSLSLEYSKDEDYARGFGLFQQMHLLKDKILCVMPRLTSALDTIHSLQELHICWNKNDLNNESIGGHLRTLETQFRGVLAGFNTLEKRTGQLVKLLSAALNYKRQSSAMEVNQGIRHLARDSAGDTATVRVITIFTLIYLPASFTATFLGMNLFAFKGSDSGSSGFTISPQFWIFITIAVPLTIITLGAWTLVVQRQKKKTAKEWGDEEKNSRSV